MRDDVGLGELCSAAAEAVELCREREVYVDFFVLRAVEGAGGGLRGSAAGVSGVAEEDELGVAIGLIYFRGCENAGPGLLRIVEDEADELYVAIFTGGVGAGRGWLGVVGLRLLLGRAAAGEERAEEVVAGDQRDDEQHNETDDADSAATTTAGETTAPGAIAPVFDIATYSAWCPVH